MVRVPATSLGTVQGYLTDAYLHASSNSKIVLNGTI